MANPLKIHQIEVSTQGNTDCILSVHAFSEYSSSSMNGIESTISSSSDDIFSIIPNSRKLYSYISLSG